MPISIPITQPSGVVTTYHRVQIGNQDYKGSGAVAIVSEYLDAKSTTFVNQVTVDVSPMLQLSVPTPPAGMLSGDFMVLCTEQYLITIAPFQGGTIVS